MTPQIIYSSSSSPDVSPSESGSGSDFSGVARSSLSSAGDNGCTPTSIFSKLSSSEREGSTERFGEGFRFLGREEAGGSVDDSDFVLNAGISVAGSQI